MRCIWCNGREGRLEELAVEGFPGLGRTVWVHPEHRAETVDSLERFRRDKSTALIAIALLMCRYPFPTLALRYSFPTSQTVRWLGIRRSVAQARGVAVVLALVGLWLIAGAPWLDPL